MRRVPLRFHLWALIAGTLLPVLAFSGWLIFHHHHQERSAAEKALASAAHGLSLAVDQEVSSSIAALQALAASEYLGAGQLERFDRFARSVLATQPHWETVVLMDVSGQQLINLRVPFGVPLPLTGDPETLKEVVRTRTPRVSDLTMARIGRRHVIGVLIPVMQAGAVRYVLDAVLSPAQMSGVLRRQKLSEDWVGSLVDRKDIIIARTAREEHFVGLAATTDFSANSTGIAVREEGSLRAGTKQGTAVYAAFSRSPLTGWTVTLRVPAAVVDAPLQEFLSLLASLSVLAAVVGAVMAAGAARRIGRPIVALSRAAPRIVSGDEPVAIPRSSVAEVDEVGHALGAASEERRRVVEENRRLSEETERRRQSAESLAEVGWLISRSLDREGVAQAIVASLRRLLNANLAVLYRIESGQLLRMACLGEGITLPPRLSIDTGLVGLAVRERRPVATPDLLNDPRLEFPSELRPVFEAGPHQAALAVPLLIRDEVVGALGVGALRGRAFSDEDVRLAEQFGDQAAIALEHATLYEGAQRRLRYTDTLLAVTQAVGSTLDLEEVFRRTIRAMAQALGAELGWAWRLTPDGESVTPLAGHNVPATIRQRVLTLAGARGHALAAATKDLRELISSSDSAAARETGDHLWIEVLPARQSVVIVPLRVKEATIGGFALGWTRSSHRITAEERDLLRGMAQAASTAVGNAELVDSATRHQTRLQALLETSRALSRIQPLDSLLQEIASACARLVDSFAVGILLVEGEELVVRATVGDAATLMRTQRLKVGEGLSGIVVRTGNPLMVIDPAEDPRHITSNRPADRRLGTRGWLGVPIKSGPRTLGVVVARTRRASAFSDEDQAIATAFAAQAATAIDNARLYHEIQSAYGELESTKNQLTQSQKMEAIGRLAGGVAHDFNNLLTVIIGRLHLLRYGLKADDPLAREFEVIEHAAFRAATLTRQLLAFSRKQVLQLKRLDLNAVVNDVVPMLRRLIGEDIELAVTRGAIPHRIMGDQAQLEQVLMNLAINARDAMPSGGRLTLETAAAQLDAAFVDQHPGASGGPHVMLAVSDTGTGMTPEVQAQIFEPFFTTKEVDKGTGLGLSTVYGIVKQHQGHIGVESAVGLGSIFRIYFPCAVEHAESVEATLFASARVTRGSETILLVEDEPDVRLVARHILQASGYTVLEATDVDDALRIADQPGTVIDLLLTDVIMPGRNGRELAEHVQHAHPETRVLFMSGYTASTIAQHGVLGPDTAFLQKPFTPDSLAVKVRDVLDSRMAASPTNPRSSTVLLGAPPAG